MDALPRRLHSVRQWRGCRLLNWGARFNFEKIGQTEWTNKWKRGFDPNRCNTVRALDADVTREVFSDCRVDEEASMFRGGVRICIPKAGEPSTLGRGINERGPNVHGEPNLQDGAQQHCEQYRHECPLNRL